jgi:hypothetical protein
VTLAPACATLAGVRTVAALYIDPRGPYPRMVGVDAWDATRDADCYDGPWPVVAHPPCGPWGRLAHLYRGNEHDCAHYAVTRVRAFGGVLEHPAESRLWEAWSLPRPGEPADAHGGYTIAVDQCEWGHVARKRTWLYLVRVPRAAITAPPFPGREPTHWISGFRSTHKRQTHVRGGVSCPPGIKVCSAEQRRRTPPAFAEWLVSLARTVT